MAIKKTAKTTGKPAGDTPARKKLTLKKDALKDMAAGGKASGVKGGANYSRAISGAL